MRLIVEGGHKQAAGVAVEPVYDARPQGVAPRREGPLPVQQRVDQGAVGMAHRRVHHQAHRLVDHDEVRVLPDNVQVDGLRLGVQRGASGGAELDALAGMQPERSRARPAVDEHGTRLVQIHTDAAARQVGATGSQEHVQARALVAGFDREGADG